MRGIIEIPMEAGRKETCWYVGQAVVNGQNAVSTTVPLTISKDADFVAKRAWLVMWPSFTGGAYTQDPFLALPGQSSVVLRDGATKRALSQVSGFSAAMFSDVNPKRAAAQMLGLPSPFLLRANNTLLAEISNPGAGALAWPGDLFLVLEGFKVYPYLPEEIPAKIQSYAIPYGLNGNASLGSPVVASNILGSRITITNGGEGKFIAKGMRIQIIDATGADKTDVLLPCLGFNLKDSTSGNKDWVTNNVQGVVAQVPSQIFTMHGSDLYFNNPRYLDPNAVVQIQPVWSDIPAAVAFVAGAATFPLTVTVNLVGALLPR